MVYHLILYKSKQAIRASISQHHTGGVHQILDVLEAIYETVRAKASCPKLILLLLPHPVS